MKLLADFNEASKRVLVYSSANDAANSPLIYLHIYDDDVATPLNALSQLNLPPFSLAIISGLSWDNDMSPWGAKAIYKGDSDFGGRADLYLKLLLENIAPKVEQSLNENAIKVSNKYIAGYSLAGLFALYALYKCEYFSGAASVSGSLWYENFLDFAITKQMPKKPKMIYLSLGDKEAKTKNALVAKVEQNTKELATHYQNCGIKTIFELNDGGHFKDISPRTARAIKALLDNL